MTSAALLLLADGRLPAGGSVHSGGIERACERGVVRDLATLGDFLDGRLATTGRVAAGVAARACAAAAGPDPSRALAAIGAHLDARTPSPAQRAAAAAQGRALLRVARVSWPSAAYDGLDGAAHPVVLGAVAAAAGCTPRQAATIAATAAVTGPASAALRLLGLDPLLVTALTARLAAAADAVAAGAAALLDRPLAELPADTGPALDLYAEQHAAAPVTLFAS